MKLLCSLLLELTLLSLVLNKAATHTDMEKYAAHADMIQDATNLCIQNTKQTELLNSWYVQ